MIKYLIIWRMVILFSTTTGLLVPPTQTSSTKRTRHFNKIGLFGSNAEAEHNRHRPSKQQEQSIEGADPLRLSHDPRRGTLKATIDDSTTTSSMDKGWGSESQAAIVAQDHEAGWSYDWRKQVPLALHPHDKASALPRVLDPFVGWYAVAFNNDIGKDPKPYGISVFDEPLVLYRDAGGALQCVSDLCPHRAAKLSEGMVTENGMIECLYHGWQFDGSNAGSCVHIPQLPEKASPPRTASVRVYPLAISEGIVFVWMGNDPWGKGALDILPVPSTVDNLDENKPDWSYEFCYNMPFDWSYLAENLLDPAHVPISHDGTRAGGNREDAAPIGFETPYLLGERHLQDEVFQTFNDGPGAPNPTGFSAMAVTGLPGAGGRAQTKRSSRYDFHAPGIVRVRIEGGKEGAPLFGSDLHCVPLGKGRSRLMFKTYGLNLPFLLRTMLALKPKVLLNLNSCKVLEQDLKLICTQEDHVARTGQSLSQAFLPIKTSDTLVIELRRWLDRVGHGMPSYVGWNNGQVTADLNDHEDTRRYDHRSNESRYHRHVLINPSTRRALATVKRVKRGGLTFAAILAACSVSVSSALAGAAPSVAPAVLGTKGAMNGLRVMGLGSACGAVCSLAMSAAAATFEGHFYKNFDRHPVLE